MPTKPKMMRPKPQTTCTVIQSEHVTAGWGCCVCAASHPEGMSTYNGMARAVCKVCGHERCDVQPGLAAAFERFGGGGPPDLKRIVVLAYNAGAAGGYEAAMVELGSFVKKPARKRPKAK